MNTINTPATVATPTEQQAVDAWMLLTQYISTTYSIPLGLARTFVPHPDGELGSLPVESEAVSLLRALRVGKKIKGTRDRAVATAFGLLAAAAKESGDVIQDRIAVRSTQGRKALNKAAF